MNNEIVQIAKDNFQSLIELSYELFDIVKMIFMDLAVGVYPEFFWDIMIDITENLTILGKIVVWLLAGTSLLLVSIIVSSCAICISIWFLVIYIIIIVMAFILYPFSIPFVYFYRKVLSPFGQKLFVKKNKE